MIRKIGFGLLAFFAATVFLFAEGEEPAKEKQLVSAEEKEITALKGHELEIKMDSLARELTAVSRRVERMEDRLERLDRDVKNLKFR